MALPAIAAVATTTIVTVVDPQGSGNTTSTATSVYGQPVAVTVAVTAASGAVAPDGSVAVYVDGVGSCTGTLGAPSGLTSTGTCNLMVPIGVTAPPPFGAPHVISASYTGTATFGSSITSGASNGSLTVNKASTTTTITAHTPNPSIVNSPIAVTVLVAVTPPGVYNGNTMPVQVSDGSATCTMVVHADQPTSCNLTPTTAGMKTLVATNLGDGIGGAYSGSTSPGVSHTVTGGGGSTFSGPTVAPGVSGTVALSGGGASCALVNPAFIAVAPLVPPPGTSFPFGLFDFSTTSCAVGGTITVQIVYSQPLPAGTQYWKFGPTPGNPPHWYVMPGSTANGATVTFAIQDGGVGDDDLTANGIVVDQGGPGAPASAGASTAIPTLDRSALAVLALMLAGLMWMSLRRRVRQ